MSFSYAGGFEVDVPASDAFAHIGRMFFENHSRWDPMIARMEKTSPGPVAVGTTGREWRKMGPRTVPNDVQVFAFEPDTRFGFEATSGALRERVVNTITPTAAGCRIGVDLTFTPAALTTRIFEPLLRRVVLRNVRRNMVRLRDAIVEDRSSNVGQGVEGATLGQRASMSEHECTRDVRGSVSRNSE